MTLLPLLLFLFANPGAFDAALRAGLTALAHNDLATAQRELEAAAKLQPKRPEVWLGLAQTYLKQRNTGAADSAAAKAEQLSPENGAVLHGLALYYSETGKPEAVIRVAKAWLAREDRADVHSLLGKAYDAAGRPAESIAELQAALRLRPFEEAPYFDLGQEFLKQQKFQAALETLQAGVNRFDRSAQLELARGVALYGLRRFPEAIDSFLRTIQLAPEVEQPYVFLGRMLDVAEAKLLAITQVFEAYHSSAPDNPRAGLLYAKALAAASADPSTIEALLRKSIQLDGANWESHFELGTLLERRRAYEEAAKELERSVQLNPNEPVPHYRLSRVYDRLGRTADAAQQRALHARLSGGVK